MKLILEGCSLLTGEIEDELNESSGQTERNYYLSGICSTPEVKNRNGRFYSRAIWEREVAKYQKEITDRTVNSLGEWQHPARSTVDPIKAVMRITELAFKDDGNVWVKAKILNDNTEITNKLKGLIKEGVKIGISTRGVGKVSATGIVEDFKLITADLVDMPSDYNAMLNGVVEGYVFENGIMLDKEYTVDENGCVGEVCGLSMNESKKLDIKDKLKSLDYEEVSSMSGKTIYRKKGSEPYTDIVIVTGNKIEASNKDTQKALSENFGVHNLEEKCPIQEKIDEAVQNAKKEIYDNVDLYLKELMNEVESKNNSLVENVDLYLRENNVIKSEEIVEATANTEITGSIMDETKAKALIQALNDMTESKKLDSELEALVRIKKITRDDLNSALEYSLTLAENDDDVKEWEKDMKEAFPEMDQAVLSKLKDKFLGR